MQRYRDLTRVRPAILNAARACAELAQGLHRPAVAYREIPIAALGSGQLHLASGQLFTCPAFDALLDASTSVIAFALTAGPEIDRQVLAFIDTGDVLEALLLETAAWLCVEESTRQFKRFLHDQASARGLGLTRRLGPGYSYNHSGGRCSWPLEQQHLLFAALGPGPLPVSLLESGAMLPKMSRSGLFGLGRLAPTAGHEDSDD